MESARSAGGVELELLRAVITVVVVVVVAVVVVVGVGEKDMNVEECRGDRCRCS